MSAAPMPAPDRALPVLEPPAVSSWRLLATLGGAGALAGLLIVLAYRWTLPSIEAHKAARLRAAVAEVLHDPARADTLFLVDGALTDTPPAGADRATLERVFRGWDAKGALVGYAITASEPGFADHIGVIFGYDPATRRILGMKVVSSKETPGLGDKIEQPAWTGQFRGRTAPLRGAKGSVAAGDSTGVVMITGATISSRTVIRAMNAAVQRWQPVVAAWQDAHPQSAPPRGRP